ASARCGSEDLVIVSRLCWTACDFAADATSVPVGFSSKRPAILAVPLFPLCSCHQICSPSCCRSKQCVPASNHLNHFMQRRSSATHQRPLSRSAPRYEPRGPASPAIRPLLEKRIGTFVPRGVSSSRMAPANVSLMCSADSFDG